VDYVYLWADGIHVNIRLEEHKLCLLVMIGVRVEGSKELIALADGYRESAESWADLLRDCARRGMRAPVLAVTDDALGFWNALREVFPQAREGRCWFHKTANVLAALPKSAHPGAKKALAEIWGAEDKPHAQAAMKAFEAAYGTKVPQGRREDHRRHKGAARPLRLPGRALGASAHHEPDRVDFRDGTPPDQDHQRARLVGGGPGGGIQAHRVSASPPAPSTHPTSSPSSCRSDLYQWQAHRTARRGHPAGRRLRDLDPQVLTIARIAGARLSTGRGTFRA
jgi:hypothetical protein